MDFLFDLRIGTGSSIHFWNFGKRRGKCLTMHLPLDTPNVTVTVSASMIKNKNIDQFWKMSMMPSALWWQMLSRHPTFSLWVRVSACACVRRCACAGPDSLSSTLCHTGSLLLIGMYTRLLSLQPPYPCCPLGLLMSVLLRWDFSMGSVDPNSVCHAWVSSVWITEPSFLELPFSSLCKRGYYLAYKFAFISNKW